jgi:hypothetical protein
MIPPLYDRPPHFPDGTDLADVDDQLLDALVANVTLAADEAVLEHLRANAKLDLTNAQETRIAVRAAIRNGLRNGALAIAPQDTWPEWWELDA